MFTFIFRQKAFKAKIKLKKNNEFIISDFVELFNFSG